MVGKKSDRHDHDAAHAFRRRFAKSVVDARLEPRLLWRTAPALISEPPVTASSRGGNAPARRLQLLHVPAPRRLAYRNAVGREKHPRSRQPGKSSRDPFRHHGVKLRVIVEQSDLLDNRRPFAHLGPRPLDVFDVLLAARVRVKRGGDEG